MHAQRCNLCEDGVESIFCVAVNCDDGYLAIVKALLKRAVGEPCLAQLQLALRVARLLSAVPAWMLAFGDANNQGCTAYAGLEVFKVGLCSQPHKLAPSTMLLAIHCRLVTVGLACNNFAVYMLALCDVTALQCDTSVASAIEQVSLHI